MRAIDFVAGAVIAGFVFGLVLLAGCASKKQAVAVGGEIESYLCALEHAELDDASLNAVCAIADAAKPAIEKAILARKAHKSDAGAPKFSVLAPCASTPKDAGQ
jgi:hypothetical protein